MIAARLVEKSVELSQSYLIDWYIPRRLLGQPIIIHIPQRIRVRPAPPDLPKLKSKPPQAKSPKKPSKRHRKGKQK